jgi:hypothetical protein
VPRYAPLPSVSLDPRNEAQLVQAASQRVYEASNQTLNDFSAGNPLAALIEGQAFAQGEFLFWLNQLPEKILIEWIGPFLGAMRRLGTASIARVVLSIPPSNTSITIPAGSSFTTDPNITGGEIYSFLTLDEYIFSPGETTLVVPVYSEFVGAIYNVPANSIVSAAAINVDGLLITNPEPATGGADVESFQEVQERFFTLIRRKNPVSAQDWQDFFTDFYGLGTQTSVLANRGSEYSYNYLTDYILPNGQVSFFVLGPGGVELTEEQLVRGQNVVNFSVPVGMTGHLYGLTLSQTQYDITLEVDANSSFGSNLRASSLDFRNRLFSILQPGNVFPSSTDPSVSDIDSAFNLTFPGSTRYVNPRIATAKAFNTPPKLGAPAALYTRVYDFEPTEQLLNLNDLVLQSVPSQVFYPVEVAFTPYSGVKKDQTIYGNLQMRQIQLLQAGNFLQGDVVYWSIPEGGDGELHVILDNVDIGSQLEIPALIAEGKISSAKTYSSWIVGASYSITSGGVYNPEIIAYDYDSDEFEPDPTSSVPLSKRPGSLIWVVSQDFELLQSSNSVTSALTAGLLGSPVTPETLIPGTAYLAGGWVMTPQIGPGPDAVADPYYNYVDAIQGAVTKYAYILQDFEYQPNDLSTKNYFDQLVELGVIREIAVQTSQGGLPIFKYKPRFPVGTYLEYRESSVSEPQYFIAAEYFTPDSTQINDLISQNNVLPLAYNSQQYLQLKGDIEAGDVKTPVRMFRFFKGDTTIFRQGGSVLSYTATTNVSPLFDFSIYVENGVFVLTTEFTENEFLTLPYIPFFNPEYGDYSEDTILSEDGRNLYRVMRAFTPSLTVADWTNTVVTNTARIQEYAGNLLRYVNMYVCDEQIRSQYGRDVSAIKLGIAKITLLPKNEERFNNTTTSYTYVWENTSTAVETPQLSWFTGTQYPYNPPNYRNGTMAL